MKLGTSIPPYRTFTLDELKEATNNFDVSTLITESLDGQVRFYKGYSPVLHLSYFSQYFFSLSESSTFEMDFY